jgi:hypothetical protein
VLKYGEMNMKMKMLVFTLVLGLASLASAGIIYDEDAVVVGGSGAVTITINGTGTPDEVWLGIDSGTATFDYTSETYGSAAGTGGNANGTAFDVSDGGYGDAWLYFENNGGVPTPLSWSDGVLFTVDVNYTAATETVISLYGPDGLNVVDTMTINVPEPMTMSLLALGGLALIRRRRA